MTEVWERDAETPDEYHSVEAIRGREFIIRLTTGADSSSTRAPCAGQPIFAPAGPRRNSHARPRSS